MEVIEEPLPGLLVIRHDVYEDERGFFLETWQRERYKKIGIEEGFVQDNWSRSNKDVLRGLHFPKSISRESWLVFGMARYLTLRLIFALVL